LSIKAIGVKGEAGKTFFPRRGTSGTLGIPVASCGVQTFTRKNSSTIGQSEGKERKSPRHVKMPTIYSHRQKITLDQLLLEREEVTGFEGDMFSRVQTQIGELGENMHAKT